MKFELKKKLDHRLNFYCPKIKLGKRKNNKVFQKELNLLGDYILCYHPSFANQNTINSLKFTKGLKYFYLEATADNKWKMYDKLPLEMTFFPLPGQTHNLFK